MLTSVVLVVFGLRNLERGHPVKNWPVRVEIVYFQPLRCKTKAVVVVICPTLQVTVV